jgi:hypothetical protein
MTTIALEYVHRRALNFLLFFSLSPINALVATTKSLITKRTFDDVDDNSK